MTLKHPLTLACLTAACLLFQQGCAGEATVSANEGPAAELEAELEEEEEAGEETSEAAAAVHRCDHLAADPDDVNRHAIGVTADEIIPVLAVNACQQAVAQHPGEPRFQYQLGRALVAQRNIDASFTHFQKAADSGYTPAIYMLAERTLAEAEEKADPKKLTEARQLLTKALDFPPAAEVLHSITFNAEGFQNPIIMQAWHDRSFEHLQNSRFLIALYARGVQEVIGAELNSYDQKCTSLVQPALVRDLDSAAAGDPPSPLEGLAYFGLRKAALLALQYLDPTWRGDASKYEELIKSLGRRDAHYLALTWGCDSSVTREVLAGMADFARRPVPLRNYYQSIIDGHPKTIFLAKPATTTTKENTDQ